MRFIYLFEPVIIIIMKIESVDFFRNITVSTLYNSFRKHLYYNIIEYEYNNLSCVFVNCEFYRSWVMYKLNEIYGINIMLSLYGRWS